MVDVQVQSYDVIRVAEFKSNASDVGPSSERKVTKRGCIKGPQKKWLGTHNAAYFE